MVQVDLITGFLGSGKTTFIHQYVSYLHEKGMKILVIENEFGSIGVDRALLRDDACDVSSLSGVCMCCKGKKMFEDLLIQGAQNGYDRILVEPSGIYDVDEFFAVMSLEKVRNYCKIGSILTIVDGQMDDALTDEAKYLMASQLYAAGSVIMSKTQLFSDSTISRTIEKLNELLAQYGNSHISAETLSLKNWSDFTPEDFEKFSQSGFQLFAHQRKAMQHDMIFQVKELADYCENAQDLEHRLKNLFLSPEFGSILRVKGHIQDLNKNWYEINCSKDSFHIRPCQMKRGLFIIIGQDLKEEAISRAFIPRRS